MIRTWSQHQRVQLNSVDSLKLLSFLRQQTSRAWNAAHHRKDLVPGVRWHTVLMRMKMRRVDWSHPSKLSFTPYSSRHFRPIIPNVWRAHSEPQIHEWQRTKGGTLRQRKKWRGRVREEEKLRKRCKTWTSFSSVLFRMVNVYILSVFESAKLKSYRAVRRNKWANIKTRGLTAIQRQTPSLTSWHSDPAEANASFACAAPIGPLLR